MKKIKTAGRYLAILTFTFAVMIIVSLNASAADVKDTFTGYDEEYNDLSFSVEYSNSCEFTGSDIKPEFRIYADKDGENVLLKEDADYEVYYDETKYPGKGYEAYIYGTGNYSFDYSFVYDISCDKAKITVADIPSKTYTGDYITPTVKVYYGKTLLSKDFYYVDHDYRTDAGKSTVYVYLDDLISNYKVKKTFTIKPAGVSALTFGKAPTATYTGDSVEPEFKVKYKNMTLSPYYDYTTTYKNNINAGTATATLTFKGNYSGKKSINFTINKLAASKVKYDSIYTQYYTGKKLTPELYLYTPSWNSLNPGKDYTVSYSNNVKPGTATATVKFKNKNISGTKKITFSIKVRPAEYLDYYIYGNKVELNWYGDYNGSFIVYKYDSSQKKYVRLKIVKKNTSYIDSGIKDYKTYKYAVKAYVKIGDKTYYSDCSYLTVKTALLAPASVKLAVKKDSITVSWSKKANATGYYVYRYDNNANKQKLVYTAKKNSIVSFTDKTVKNYGSYTYWVVAYKTEKGKTTKSNKSIYADSLDMDSINRGIKLKSKKSYKLYNTQGSKTYLVRTVTLSTADINTLKNFAKKHFKSGMTPQEKVAYTLNWIHSQVTYASSNANWNKICNKTYVDAIFNYKLGQCAQYNGALAGMMTYLGYDVQLIMGYRSSGSQHFWVECKINGLTYLMECGNKKDGDWWYLFTPYKYTRGYTKNGKYVSGR